MQMQQMRFSVGPNLSAEWVDRLKSIKAAPGSFDIKSSGIIGWEKKAAPSSLAAPSGGPH